MKGLDKVVAKITPSLLKKIRIACRRAASGLPTFGMTYQTSRGSRVTALEMEFPLREVKEQLARIRSCNSLARACGYLAEQVRELTRPLGIEPPLGPAEGFEWCDNQMCRGLRVGRVVAIDEGFVLAPEGESTEGFLAELCFCEGNRRLEIVEPRFGVLSVDGFDRPASRILRFDGEDWRTRDGWRDIGWPEPVEFGRYPSWVAAEAVWVRR